MRDLHLSQINWFLGYSLEHDLYRVRGLDRWTRVFSFGDMQRDGMLENQQLIEYRYGYPARVVTVWSKA